MIRHAFFDVLVVETEGSKETGALTALARVVEPLRGQASRERVELELSGLRDAERETLLRGGRFLVFAVATPDSNRESFKALGAAPALPETVEAARRIIPLARQVERVSGALLVCLAIMPGLFVGLQVKLRRLSRQAPDRVARVLASTGLSFCLVYFILALTYVWVAPPGPPAARVDLLAILPFCAYCACVSLEFLETWASGKIRGRE